MQHTTSLTSRIPTYAPARIAVRRSTSHIARAKTETPHDWHRQLTGMAKTAKAQGVLTGDVSERLASDSWVLVDVRPKADFAKSHHDGALNIPLFDKPENPGMKDMVKRAALLVNGVAYVDYNEGFVDAVKTAAAGGKGLIFVDEGRGRLVGEGDDGRGKASRALKALYLAIDAGIKPVDFLRGEGKQIKR